MLNLLHMIKIQKRKLCLGDFVKYTCNIGFRTDAHEQIFFKLGVVLDMTIFYSFIPV